MIRARLRAVAVLAVDIARVLGAELAEWGSKKVSGLIFQAPNIQEVGNPGFQVEEEDHVLVPSDDELNAMRRDRISMVAKREPTEDNPPLAPPLVGSREWRRQHLVSR